MIDTTRIPRRILIVTRNLPPLLGGMERLNWHMAEELGKRAEVRLIGPAGAAAVAPPGVRVIEVPLKPLPRFLLAALWAAWRTSRTWRPHVVLAGSGLTAPLARFAARSCGAFAAGYIHGLDITVRHPLYRALWLPSIRRLDRVIANSRATAQLATDAGVDATRTAIVHPGVDIPSWPRDEAAATRFRSEHELSQAPVLLSVGRFTRRKGLREFVTEVLPRIVAARPQAVLLIVGDAPRQALHAEPQTRESIQSAADAAGVGRHLHFMGVVANRELATAYRAADVHVFPVQHIAGDPEGFGMVAIEAAAHGLPTVAYATGGVVDAVEPGKSGRLVPPGDSAAMANAIEETLSSRDAMRPLCRAFAERFAWAEFGIAIANAIGLESPG